MSDREKSTPSDDSPRWWELLYDDTVAELLMRRKKSSEVRATVDFLQEKLQIKPGDRVFDQCCGIGSLSIPLARAGLKIVGVDQARAYAEEAAGIASAEKLNATFLTADATEFVAVDQCDAGFNWNTSFGNGSDRENARMLDAAFRSLRPGGWFALDYQHIPRILIQFQKCMVNRLQDDRGETLLVRESFLDLANGHLKQVWTMCLPDGTRKVRPTCVRLYLPHELGNMLRAAGFTDITFYGDVNGEELNLHLSLIHI